MNEEGSRSKLRKPRRATSTILKILLLDSNKHHFSLHFFISACASSTAVQASLSLLLGFYNNSHIPSVERLPWPGGNTNCKNDCNMINLLQSIIQYGTLSGCGLTSCINYMYVVCLFYLCCMNAESSCKDYSLAVTTG